MARLTVTPELANAYNTMHGGATATLVDILGTLALLSLDPTKPGVTIELSCSYMAAAAVGDDVECKGTVLRAGRKIGYTQVELIRARDGKLLASGRHTKAL